jgi:hypothetical protein
VARAAAAHDLDRADEAYRAVEHEFVGVSDARSFEAALSDALRNMDRAVADQGRSPCSSVKWHVAEISGTSGTPAALKRLEVKIVASFERPVKQAWGEPGPDLRMVVSIHPRDRLRIGDQWQGEVALENTGEQPREIVGHLDNLFPQSDDQPKPIVLGNGSKEPMVAVQTALLPGETKTIHRFVFRVRPLEELSGQAHVEKPTMFIRPGDYSWSPNLRFHFTTVPEETHDLVGPTLQLPILSPL